MAAERHVGAPECLNETCSCGSLPKPEQYGPALKERRERIATAVLAGLAARGTRWSHDDEVVAERLPYASLAASIAKDWADALIVELDK